MFGKEIHSITALMELFPNEQCCIDYLEGMIWGCETPESPFDSSSKVYKCSDNRYRCKNTGKYFNVKHGTMFENTKLPMIKWFIAIWMDATIKKGISSPQLAKQINVTQQTAWIWHLFNLLTKNWKCCVIYKNSSNKK